MPSLQQYVLEPLTTGGFDEETIADICKELETVLSYVSDPYKVPAAVERKMMRKKRECLGGVAAFALRVAGKNFLFVMRRPNVLPNVLDNMGSGFWSKLRDGVEKGNLGEVKKYTQSFPNTAMIVMAKIQGVRSLQDLAAYQVACSPGTNLEMLPKLIKKVVSKFKFELPKTKSKYMII
eukprot:GFUD01110867.1.p1 GENE.GFUD01110867.1~~GFUD01110867.1.p1  ORF type:complete len:179 (-),score=43.75 GFUD01110867.1:21-557(-)